MAVHRVTLACPDNLEVLHKDVEISVESDGGMLGMLTVSKGGIGWYPRDKQYERLLSWERFDRLWRTQFGDQ